MGEVKKPPDASDGAQIFFPVAVVPAKERATAGEKAAVVVSAVHLEVLAEPTDARRGAQPRKIRQAPGGWILKAADFLCSPAAVENVYEASVADLRHEYFEALREGRRWKARVARLRGYGFLAVTVLSHWLGGLLKLVKAGKSLMG